MDSDNPDLYNTNDKNKKDKAGRGQELGQQERRLQQGIKCWFYSHFKALSGSFLLKEECELLLR